MPLPLYLALALLALLAIGMGAWLVLAVIVATIAPNMPAPEFAAMPRFPPAILAIVLTLGAILFMTGASGYARLAVLA